MDTTQTVHRGTDDAQTSPSTRSRRSMLAGAATAAGALAAQALIRPTPVAAADVVLGAVNTADAATTIRTTEESASAKALIGLVTTTIAGSSTAGVQGQSNAENGSGVFGLATNGAGARGVLGQSALGVGVHGQATATTVANVGVRGTTPSTAGYGVQGVASATSGNTYGVSGSSASPGGRGVQGTNTAIHGVGVLGIANSGTGSVGVLGRSRDGIGVRAEATATGFTPTYGVWAQSATYRGVGVLALSTYASDVTTHGLWGQSNAYFGVGVMGYASSGVGPNSGVRGECEGAESVGVAGWAKKTTGVNYGVHGLTSSPDGYAGYFQGNTHVQGTFTSSDKQFLIDHPVRPATMTLAHACVEAPERLNVYRGTVRLDDKGSATARLPRYVGALNADYSYQLTPIGPTTSVLYIARELSRAGSFRIAGGTPGLRVCWQVTGARKDAWAQQHPFRVERRKRRRDQGKYLDPALHGKPKSDALYPPPRSVKRPQLRRRGRREATIEAA
jgi:hypothetical protein